jgi:hypothetical protein
MIHALTLRSKGGLLPVIISDVGVSLPFLETVPITIISFKGIWDTGATGSVITKNVVDKLQLKVTGQKLVNHAQGSDMSNTYLVNLSLPMDVTIPNITVTEGKLPSGVDLLIGMDIITLGDFSITNKDKNTVMTFRIPSVDCHDFIPHANNSNKFEKERLAREANRAKKGKKK